MTSKQNKNDALANSCCCGNLPVCILHLGENGLKKYRLAKKWEQFKIVLLFMDHPVYQTLLEKRDGSESLQNTKEAKIQ